MTYLDVVNNILKRLREQTVTTVDATPYSKLIGILVNDSKADIQNAWKWSALRTSLVAVTSNGTFGYAMDEAKTNFEVLNVVNDTENTVLRYIPQNEMSEKLNLSDLVYGSPQYYSFNGTNLDGDSIIEFYPIPDDVYNINIDIVERTGDYTSDTDVVLLPEQPLILLAYAKAVEERGEDGGGSSNRAFANAERSISDHIALDANRHPEELIWAQV